MTSLKNNNKATRLICHKSLYIQVNLVCKRKTKFSKVTEAPIAEQKVVCLVFFAKLKKMFVKNYAKAAKKSVKVTIGDRTRSLTLVAFERALCRSNINTVQML